ncbi:unnamed protein product [Moneuplotes crassus]|uniref:Uncharacterized protein n=1 Tax=Euplotes crassus TaxID=5936 RepID=A0AAD1Y8X6_EUPCR|nr:unnamed protein product [Moneuplotes crassus]
MSTQVKGDKRCQKPSNPAHAAFLKLCCFSQKKDIVPKACRKYSLGHVTNEGFGEEDTSAYFEKVCKEIKQLENEYEHRNDSPSKRMKRGLLHIKRQRDHLSERLIDRIQHSDKTAFKQLLKNMNKLKSVRDFDNFCKAHDIGNLDENESISDCEQNLDSVQQSDHSYDISNPRGAIIAPESCFSSCNNQNTRKSACKDNKKKVDSNKLFKDLEMKRDRVGSSVTDTKDIQENLTGTSPIPTCDIVRNKIFDFSRPKTDMKRSQILHKNDRLSPALEIAFKKTTQLE